MKCEVKALQTAYFILHTSYVVVAQGAMRTNVILIPVLLAACAPESVPSPAMERAPVEGEVFFAGLRQITFGGQNAEAYFSPDGTQLIFQKTVDEQSCDQQYTMNLDGSNARQISHGGRTTCGYFYNGGSRILYASTVHVDSACPAPPIRRMPREKRRAGPCGLGVRQDCRHRYLQADPHY